MVDNHTGIPPMIQKGNYPPIFGGNGLLYNAFFDKKVINYGYLYNWYAVDKIAPTGWRIPTIDDFNALIAFLGGNEVAGGKLKETSLTHWVDPNEGATNESGFTARGAGLRFSGFHSLMEYNEIWLSEDVNPEIGLTIELCSVLNTCITKYSNKKIGSSVRLVKNTTSIPNATKGSYTGNDGKTYITICIGTTEWMLESLCETKYNDGTDIPEVTDDSAWDILTTGARCSYNNDESYALNVITRKFIEGFHLPTDVELDQLCIDLGTNLSIFKSRGIGRRLSSGEYQKDVNIHDYWGADQSIGMPTSNDYLQIQISPVGLAIQGHDKHFGSSVRLFRDKVLSGFGFLYNRLALTDTRNIAPLGWHSPDIIEGNVMENSIGATGHDGGKLKETGFKYWNEPNSGATNEKMFNARGAGLRAPDGTFEGARTRMFFWTMDGYYGMLSSTADDFGFINGWGDTFGLSVRLVKDSTELTDGQTGTMVDNDGNTYETICIGSQEWMAENLRCTSYRYFRFNWSLSPSYHMPSVNLTLYDKDGGAHVITIHTDLTTTITDVYNQIIANAEYIALEATDLIHLTCDGTYIWVLWNRFGTMYTLWQQSDNLFIAGYPQDEAIPLVEDNASWAAETEGARCSYNNDPYYNEEVDNVVDVDGNLYQTVKIGDQVVMDQNLKTKHYSDGSPIKYKYKDSDWANDTEGAWCFFMGDNRYE